MGRYVEENKGPADADNRKCKDYEGKYECVYHLFLSVAQRAEGFTRI